MWAQGRGRGGGEGRALESHISCVNISLNIPAHWVDPPTLFSFLSQHQVSSDRLVPNSSLALTGMWSLLFTSPGSHFRKRQLQPRETPSLAQGHTAWWWERQTLTAPAGLSLSGQASVSLGDRSALSWLPAMVGAIYRESAGVC